jgi:hypothetical protein
MFATKTRLFGFLSMVVLSFGLAACGDDDDDGSKQLNELSDEEAQAICEDRKSTLEEVQTNAATVECYGEQLGNKAGCDDAAAAACIDAAEGVDCSEGGGGEETCTATVDEFFACLESQNDVFGGIIAGMNCENAVAKFTELQTALQEGTPECDALEQECPSDSAEKMIKSRFNQ